MKGKCSLILIFNYLQIFCIVHYCVQLRFCINIGPLIYGIYILGINSQILSRKADTQENLQWVFLWFLSVPAVIVELEIIRLLPFPSRLFQFGVHCY
jgi:hypothetical protein